MRCRVVLGALVAAWGVGCGDAPTSVRPVEVDVQGVGEDAARVVALWLEGADRECTDLAGRDVRAIEADARDVWSPSDPDRALQLPESDVEAAVLVLYTEDATGAVTGCACRQIRYADFERPDLVIRLLPGGC